MAAEVYYARDGQTLKDVADETGVDYAKIVRLNKAYIHRRLLNGMQIMIDLYPDPEEEEEAEEEVLSPEEEEREAKEREQAERAAAAARKKEAQIAQANATIDAAEKEYRQESAYANADHTHKVNRLTEQMRVNRSRLEGDLARQKIADSSIAQNERTKLDKQEADERESIDMQTAHKLEQLQRKKENTQSTQRRRIAGL